MKKNNLFTIIFLWILIMILLIIISIYDKNNKDKNEKFKPDEKERKEKRNIDLYEKNDVSVDNAKNEQIDTSMRTINPVTNFVDYTYFNNRNKRHSYNIGFEPQSPIQTEKNVSFTIKP